MAAGFNTSIVYMIVSVFALIGFVVYQMVRAVRQMEAREAALEAAGAA